MRENIFTHISVQASVGTSAATAGKDHQTAMRAESHKQSAAQSAEKTSNQNIALNGSAVTASAISGGGGNTHRPQSELNSGKHLTRLASLILATLLLAACGGGGSSGSSGGGASGVQVTNLKAIPGSGSLTLTWDNPNANISSFNIDVYDLDTNATDNRVAAASQANRTISSSPAVNTTAPLAKVRYIIPSGLVNDSNYSVAVTVNLQGADAGKATSARGLSGRRYLPANRVRIGANTDEDQYADSEDNCREVKNDDQANTYGGADNIGDVCGDIDNDGIVDADDNCAVVANTNQQDTAGNGIGDACDSTFNSDGDDDADGIVNSMDNCPLIANPGQEDGDSDNVGDICDVDADGDGLIELRTAAELNMMRYNLAGTNLTITAGGAGNSMGCGGGLHSNGTRIITCNGYEQMEDIDLEDLGRDASGSNWEPIGNCGNGLSCDDNTIFNGMFSGNDFTISNLFINITTDRSDVGFFGAISSNSQVRNVHIRGGTITGVTSTSVGGLVGYGVNAKISNSSGNLAEISGQSFVGGLVGSAVGATISSSVVRVGSISGTGSNVGGLVGIGHRAIISSSVVRVGSISGINDVGGLAGDIGFTSGATISSSVATVSSISGSSYVGGLVGYGRYSAIRSSIATVGSISGGNFVGGLVGFISSSNVLGFGTISSSVAVTNNITDTSNVGALVGGMTPEDSFQGPASVTYSYWDNIVVGSDGMMLADNDAGGNAQTTAALQNPVVDTTGDGSFPAGIYSEWDNAYCNPNTGEYRETAPSPLGGYVRVWDLGEGDEYPAITCVGNFFSLAAQREAAGRAFLGESPLVD